MRHMYTLALDKTITEGRHVRLEEPVTPPL
jgi:hypothetical protein